MKRYFSKDRVARIRQRFERLYPGEDPGLLLERLLSMVGRYGVGSEEELEQTEWDERDAVLITYGDMIQRSGEPPLRTLKTFCDEYLQDAFQVVHVLPFFPFTSDDGFSVKDYRAVDENLGSWPDIEALAEHFDLMFDLVLNHVSRGSEWFKNYLLDVAPYRHYFIETDPEADLSAVVRPRSHPLLTSVTTQNGERHLWTTFSRDQVDLDFSNPDVLFEMLDVLFFHIARGMRIVRLDAIAYLWKRIGTNCIHLEETHEVVKMFRDVVDMAAPQVKVLTETNVPHEENISYFGSGNEAHMVYQFSLPPLMLHALHTGNARFLTDWAGGLGDPPAGCTYLNFAASHDGIGVRPLKGLIPDQELDALIEGIRARGGEVSMKRNPDGSESPYELNITYVDALRNPDDPTHDLTRFLCSQVILLGLKGVPAIYFHSLTATPNDLEGVKQTGRARSINRRKWHDVELRELLTEPDSNTTIAFRTLTEIMARRAELSCFHPRASQTMHDAGTDCFAFSRTSPDGSLMLTAVHNVTSKLLDIPLRHLPALKKGRAFHDVVADDAFPLTGSKLSLQPYQCVWLMPDKPVAVDA